MNNYETILVGTLSLTVLATVLLFVSSFISPFSLLALVNSFGLATVLIPIATNGLDISTQIGCWLWLAAGILNGLTTAESARYPTKCATFRAGIGLLGWIAFGSHVLIF